MCTQRLRLKNGKMIPCHRCEQCLLTKKNDFVGRLIAESRVCRGKVHMVTLTYGGDEPSHCGANGQLYYYGEVLKNPAAVNFYYEHIQKWLKLVRKYSAGCRFFCVGELGDAKGRVHWHIIVFWDGETVPNIHEGWQRYMHWIETPEQARALGKRGKRAKGKPLWPHGWSRWDLVRSNAGAMEYVCKYLTKSNVLGSAYKDGYKRRGMSNQPPLGALYFEGLAREMVEGGFALRDYKYAFADVRKEDGYRREFFMPHGASRDRYIGSYIAHFYEKHGHMRWPYSEPIEQFLDRLSNGNVCFTEDEEEERYRLSRADRPENLYRLLRTALAPGERLTPDVIGNDILRFDEKNRIVDEPDNRFRREAMREFLAKPPET